MNYNNLLDKYWVQKQSDQFWFNLLFNLQISPYFGKLGWKLKKGYQEALVKNLSKNKIEMGFYRLGISSINPTGKEEAFVPNLMKHLFDLPLNYQRPNVLWSATSPFDNPSYMRYSNHSQSILCNEPSQPLQDSHILPEDIQMFKSKLKLLSENQLPTLVNYYVKKISKAKMKLGEWIKKVEKTHD